VGIFKFKKFSVCDDGATMKVGTDGVLLGAWANPGDAKTILDIGTGSGIIALMIAQRSIPEARIDAIELLEQDSRQAVANVLSSPWREKISIINTSIQNFASPASYDLIISNPPFFSGSLLSPSARRSSVRHDIQLTYDDLISVTIRLLSLNGRLCIILPAGESDSFAQKALARKLFLNRLTRFFTRPGKPQERSLMEFGFIEIPLIENSLTLYHSGARWTDEYTSLTKDFYLNKQL
jgi:tRNA1Val (adenine37-N6)-methyltransferase